MTDTLFKQVNYSLGALVDFIELGSIGLPDLQRPFVWKKSKVRDLLDSMYRGYPVGYFLFWQNGFVDHAKAIGSDSKQKTPDTLIVDGQQRLTSLYAVTKGIPVLRGDGTPEKIEIGFNPLKEQFEVADAAVRNDPAYVPNVSDLWDKNGSLFEAVDEYLAGLEKSRPVSAEERRQIQKALTRVHGLTNFPFTALELSRDLDEEQVAEVFVRINSKGKALNQADFILTLMSVFWEEGRQQLEAFCRASRKPSAGEASPFNHFIDPDPDQLLRVSIAVGFKRARLQYVYSILRGKDLETGEFSDTRRDEQFEVLQQAQARVLDLTSWGEFFRAIRSAGYLGGRMISSQNNLLYAYAFFLLGRTEFDVPPRELRRVIARWFFMCALTGRYTGSPESNLEFDLAKLKGVETAEDFVGILDRECDTNLTNDFWGITLPNDLATSSPRSPSLFAYYAALVLEDATALFSDQKISDLLEPSVHSTRKAAERHHLFPKAHLKKQGIAAIRDTNQIANFALLEWGDNSAISDEAPEQYVPVMGALVPPQALANQYRLHGLPDGWENLEYARFLTERRERMARVIRTAAERLVPTEQSQTDLALDVEGMIEAGEGIHVEFKSTLRTNLHTGEKDARMELAVLKTIAGFLNTRGGTLVVGVSDDGETVGLERDGFANEDKLHLHLSNLIQSRIGVEFAMYIEPHFEDRDEQRVLVVRCSPAGSPVFVTESGKERYFVRNGAATAELGPKDTQHWITKRFA